MGDKAAPSQVPWAPAEAQADSSWGEANPEAQNLALRNEGLPPSGEFLGSESGTWGPAEDQITSQMGNVPEPEQGPTGQAVLCSWEVLSVGLLGGLRGTAGGKPFSARGCKTVLPAKTTLRGPINPVLIVLYYEFIKGRSGTR